jgi:predicted TIM-barrel fold metal-dependent hydrolase
VTRVIDSHVHLYPSGINRDPAGWARAAGEPAWGVLATRRRRSGEAVQTFPAVGELLIAMDTAGIERAVLLGWYWQTPQACRLQNEFYAACRRAHPDRLSACAAVQPAAGSAAVVAELRFAREEGLQGIGELSPHAQGYGADDPVFGQVLAQAGEWDWRVTLHVTDPASRPYPGRVETPWEDFVRLAAAFPQTSLILAHWGGLFPLTQKGPLPGNVYVDTAASPLLYGPEIWQRFISAVGPGRVLFGSDFPLNLYPRLDPEPNLARFVAEVRAAGLSPGESAAVLRENARRWFA